jgi:SCP1.201-like deaminase
MLHTVASGPDTVLSGARRTVPVMPIDSVISGLGEALAAIDRARCHLLNFDTEWDHAARGFTGTIDSRHEEAGTIRLIVEAMSQQVEDIIDAFNNAEAGINQMIKKLNSSGAEPTTGGLSPVRSAKDEMPPPTGITNAHGDRYPQEAGALVAQLPKRVTPGAQERTVGVARMGDRELPEMSSGYDPVWSRAAEKHLESLGVNPERLQHHVEVKLVAMMIDTRQPHAEVAINYTPCGVEIQRLRPDTCDKVLGDLLPAGYTVTVYGTTQDNKPFRRTYGE